jgi:hypothetical protein
MQTRAITRKPPSEGSHGRNDDQNSQLPPLRPFDVALGACSGTQVHQKRAKQVASQTNSEVDGGYEVRTECVTGEGISLHN